ncbi:hypothetical protein AB0B10_12885 [Micromonospora arborensis]|uniref:hypothetical protein n=1 Tax=Micromonospora arborensis TaxID=2116518 RepID=UPI0033DEAA74
MAGLIVLNPGIDWTATGGLFDWTLEFLIPRLADRQAADHLQEIVDNNLGSLWLDNLPAAARREIVRHWRDGLVTAGERQPPKTEHKVDVIRHLRELVDATSSAGFPGPSDEQQRPDHPGRRCTAGRSFRDHRRTPLRLVTCPERSGAH